MKGRLEDRRLLTGQGRFISDWNFPNQAYCAFLRSDRAHAEIVSVDVAAALEAPGVLHAELPGNLSFDWVAGDEAATEAAFRAADRVVKLALENPRMVGNPMEPRACAGTYDAATQKYALYACTQGTAGMRGQLVYTMG